MLCRILHIGIWNIENFLIPDAIPIFRDVIMNKESFNKGGVRLAVIYGSFIVAALIVLMQALPSPRLMTDEQGFSYIGWGDNVVSATEATPTAGASSILEIFFVNHSGTGATA